MRDRSWSQWTRSPMPLSRPAVARTCLHHTVVYSHVRHLLQVRSAGTVPWPRRSCRGRGLASASLHFSSAFLLPARPSGLSFHSQKHDYGLTDTNYVNGQPVVLYHAPLPTARLAVHGCILGRLQKYKNASVQSLADTKMLLQIPSARHGLYSPKWRLHASRKSGASFNVALERCPYHAWGSRV
jgi:hypothetical protein